MSTFIKQFDDFGHPITLNMHQSKGANHKTTLGGVVSVMMKTLLFVILCFNIAAMFDNQNSQINKQVKLKKTEDLKEIISFKDTGITTSIIFYGFDGIFPVPKTPDEVKEFVSIKSV